jgi:hypothetical protein
MTGAALFLREMAWCHSNVSRDKVEQLQIDLHHPWIRFAMKCSLALWRRWEDFLFLPTPHFHRFSYSICDSTSLWSVLVPLTQRIGIPI